MKLIISLLLLTNITFAQNTTITSFSKAKTKLRKLYGNKNNTFYCDCPYQKKSVKTKKCKILTKKYKSRKSRIEWEHIVPAHAFGQSFKEWRDSANVCGTRKTKSGKTKKIPPRKCAAQKSKTFRLMESDIYNLVPAVGSINAMRSNYSMAELSGKARLLCEEGFRVEGRKVMPPKDKKGDIARIYLYMDNNYPGRGVISKKNKKLFKAWNKLDPVNKEECILNRKKQRIQGNPNQIVMSMCKKLGL